MEREFPIEKVRNFGIIAHIDAGKTTTSERVLFYTGQSHKIGEVHEGETTTDWMEQERERGITITAAAVSCTWIPTYEHGDKNKRFRFNIIDTPGHIDFTVEVKRSLRVLDGAVVVFDGVAGVEPQSETNWRYADEANVPRICFVNKLDRTGASFEHSYKTILDRLSKKAVRAQLPIGLEENHEGVVDLLKMKAYYFEGNMGIEVIEKEIPENMMVDALKYRAELLERIVENDEVIMNEYLDGKEPSLEVLKSLLRKAVIANEIFPVYAGSALKNKGVQLVLDAVVDYLPAPTDIPPVSGTDINDEEIALTRKPDDKEPFSALAFKSMSDPFVGQLVFFRVYSGSLEAGSYIYNPRTRSKERIGRIVRMQADQREEVKKIFAGEIAAAVGLKETKTSDTLTDEANPIMLDRIKFPEPVINLRIEPKTKADQEKMGLALNRLSDEDPTFKVSTDPETEETIIAGMGELHLEIIVDRMKREFNVEANVGKPQVAYRETITGEAQAEGKYIKQSGGKGNYGHVKIKIKPMDQSVNVEDLPKNVKRTGGFEFINTIKGGAIPSEFIPPIEKGLKEGLDRGIVAGFKMENVSVELYDGSYHDVDSNEMAFKIAASMAIKEAASAAKPVILEPMMQVEVITPDKFMGDVTGSLSSRRGLIEGMENRGLSQAVKAVVPLSEMFGYMTTLRSMTEGRASFTMEFIRYDIVPQNVAATIAESRK
ncbi:MAG: elongation factor G [Candidatus Paceibacterota bacterium]